MALYLVADMLDVSAEAFGCLAAGGACDGQESQGQNEKSEAFQKCFHWCVRYYTMRSASPPWGVTRPGQSLRLGGSGSAATEQRGHEEDQEQDK